MSGPRLAIERIHIRGLRSIRELNLPEQGMGWDGKFPNVAVIGGANGSGKTTLLRYIVGALELLLAPQPAPPYEVAADEARVDFEFLTADGEPLRLVYNMGDGPFVPSRLATTHYGYIGAAGRWQLADAPFFPIDVLLRGDQYAASTIPRVVLFPSDQRDFVVPRVTYMMPGRLDDDAGFVSVWRRPGEQEWGGSTMELFFSARWADLNAKEQGRPDEAIQFQRFTRAFADLTGGKKRLTWTTKGDLVVQLADGTTHAVDRLSSGERQALLLLAELRRLWRPGSLIMIDEPELHLHDNWQGKILSALIAMQAELGGQVILTTQSHSLFGMAPLGSRALLGQSRLR